jgi:hypothetical protein
MMSWPASTHTWEIIAGSKVTCWIDKSGYEKGQERQDEKKGKEGE